MKRTPIHCAALDVVAAWTELVYGRAGFQGEKEHE
jgi:hypothetical protein